MTRLTLTGLSATLWLACTVPDYAADEPFLCDGDRHCAAGWRCDLARGQCVDTPAPDDAEVPPTPADQGADQGPSPADLGPAADQGAPDQTVPPNPGPDCLGRDGQPVPVGQPCVEEIQGCAEAVCGLRVKLQIREGLCGPTGCEVPPAAEVFDASMACPAGEWCGAAGLCAPDPECDANPCALRRDGLICNDDGDGRLSTCVTLTCCGPGVLGEACNPRGPGHPVPAFVQRRDTPFTWAQGERVALDPATGLAWRVERLQARTPNEGQGACDTLALYTDPTQPRRRLRWRLPDWHALASLGVTLNGRSAPDRPWLELALGNQAGTRFLMSRTVRGGQFFALDVTAGRLVRLAPGEVNRVNVLCVAYTPDERPAEAYAAPLGQGAADLWTGLAWSAYQDPLAFADASALCRGPDAVLPTVAELGSLLDLHATPDIGDRLAGGAPTPKRFWTSESFNDEPLVVDFATGEAYPLPPDSANVYLRCVQPRDL